MVWARGQDWGVDPDRIGILGPDPDPALVEALSSELQVTARTPLTFLFHSDDDGTVAVMNSIVFFEALKKAKVPAEMHVFAHGRHGVGLAPEDPMLSQWPTLCAQWMEGLGPLTVTSVYEPDRSKRH